ncbi:peptide-methionine (S)-S-oxide reductase MsrA [Mycobacterium sp. NPDC003449]
MTPRRWTYAATGLGLVLIAAVALIGGLQAMPTGGAATSISVPPPAVDEPVRTGVTSETAVLAGGCFWGVQGVYQHVKGVVSAESGYDGGSRETADYPTVGTGTTGHAESVRITYDPTQVTYGQLLRIFFSVAHDPTELNRQGPDTGTQYRSVIFTQNASQQRIAEAYVAQLNRDAIFPATVVTSISPNTEFFPAEPYHQDYLTSNPTNSYIKINDLPKVENLKHTFPELYRDDPVLMSALAR